MKIRQASDIPVSATYKYFRLMTGFRSCPQMKMGQRELPNEPKRSFALNEMITRIFGKTQKLLVSTQRRGVLPGETSGPRWRGRPEPLFREYGTPGSGGNLTRFP